MAKFFNLQDIVVWDGIIVKYEVIQHIVNLKDDNVDIRKANTEEISRWLIRPETLKYNK